MPALIPDEQAALLAAIVAEPDDDTPRLVYADWLQEHGDEEQASYIRDSISIDWLAGHEDDSREEVANRIDRLTDRNGERWLEALGVRPDDMMYDRGMVSGVIYREFDSFLADAPVLFARVPVRDLTIRCFALPAKEAPDAFFSLAAMTELTKLRALRLWNNGGPAFGSWESFVTSPCLANLELLSVKGAGLIDADMAAFDRCEHLNNLEELGLAGNELTAAGALTVVRSRRLPKLRRLALAYNNIVEDRRDPSYSALREALHKRFDGTQALGFDF